MTVSLIVVVLAFVILAAVGLLLVWRFRISTEDCEGPLGTLIAPCVLSIYLIAMAMGVVIGWENRENAADNVVREAAAATDLYWSTASFPREDAQRVRADLRDYTEAVVTEDWPLMRGKERLSRAGDSRMSGLRVSVNRVPARDPATALDRMTAREEVRELVDLRIKRADSAEDTIPRALTISAAVTGLAVVVMPFAMGLRGSATRVLWAAANLVFVGATVAVLLFLDNPYAGLIPVDAGPLEDARAEYERIDEALSEI